MLYNKNNVRKVNDKKVLRKVGKQWKVVSVALLLAIGGGLAVAHSNVSANADSNITATAPQTNNTNSASAQNTNSASNNGLNSSVASEVEKLEALPLASATPNSAKQSVQSNSTKSASSNSAVSYVSGDAGSAASYHAKQFTDQSSYDNANSSLANYRNALEAREPQLFNNLNQKYVNARSAYNNDNSLANSYSAVANNPANASIVSDLAAKAGLDVNDYTGAVQYTTQSFSNNVKSASASLSSLSNERNFYHALATTDWTTSSENAQVEDAIANANANVASDNVSLMSNNNSNAIQASESNAVAYDKADSASVSASGALVIANLNSANDTSYVNSLAGSLNVSADAIRNAINSAVMPTTNVTASGVITDGNANASNNFINKKYNASLEVANGKTIAGNSSMASVASDFAAISGASSIEASANSTMVSANNAKASLSNAVVEDSVAYNSDVSAQSNAKKSLSVADANEFVTSGIAHYLTSNNDNVANMLQQAITYYNNHGSLAHGVFYKLAGFLANASNTANAVNSAEADNVATYVSEMGINPSSASVSAIGTMQSYYNPFFKSFMTNTSADNADLDNLMSSAESNANNSLNSAEASATSYANSADTNTVLASYYATSYANDAKSDSTLASSASSAMSNAYGAQYASDKANAQSLASDVAVDKAFANAYGHRVFNYAPKHIVITKNCILHSNTDYGDANDADEDLVIKGSELDVKGVGFASNGALRYLVSYNGHEGYVTANPKFSQEHYLLAKATKPLIAVRVNKRVLVHKNAQFTDHATKSYRPGTELKGVVYAEPDSNFNNDLVYGGFSRIQLTDGTWITSSTDFVSVVNSDLNANTTPAKQQAPAQPQQNLISFAD